MGIHKDSRDEFTKLKPWRRLVQLKWWFLLFLLLGIIALVLVVTFQSEEAIRTIQQSSLELLPLSVAHAQNLEDTEPTDFTPRVIIMTGVFGVLTIVYIIAIIKLLFTRTADKVDDAADLVKTLTGFFVGAATGFLG